MSEPTTVARLLEIGERVLTDSSHIFEDHDRATEARELLAFALGVDEDELVDDDQPPRRVRDRYLSLVARRAAGEPFPILTGHIEFYGLDLKVWPGAFVPRPSSELTVDRAVRRVRRASSPVIVDLCTGAGPIALAIADEVRHAEVWGADIADEGLKQARRNARALDIPNVHFRRADMYDGLPRRLEGRVDVVTGHIPYVPPGEVDDLPAEVREHEPIYTLTDASTDGLFLMRRAIADARRWLKPGGWLLLEVSDDLPKTVQRLCARAGLENRGIASDEDDLSVVVEARNPRGGSKRPR